MKTALITGVGGQVGSYLAELLLNKAYMVYGLIRRSSVHNTGRIDHLSSNINFHKIEGDVTDAPCINNIISGFKPDEVYNLAAQSHVKISFDQPATTLEINAMGPLYILEAIRRFSPSTKFLQASTSELFGDTQIVPQNEATPMHPVSPYAVAKLCAHNFVDIYGKAYGIFACASICFNNESPRRGEEFVTRKITKYIAQIANFMNCVGKKPTPGLDVPFLKLGNLDAKRDWSHTRDIVRGMWSIMQQPVADDYVLGSGKTYSVKDFLEMAFGVVNLNYVDYVDIDVSCCRPLEVNVLQADCTKAQKTFGWKTTVDFSSLVKEMIYNDINMIKK